MCTHLGYEPAILLCGYLPGMLAAAINILHTHMGMAVIFRGADFIEYPGNALRINFHAYSV